MPSEALASVLEEMAADARRSGAAADTFDVEAYRSVLSFNPGEMPPKVRIRPAGCPDVSARWVYRADATQESRLVYLHGGGLVAGGWGSHRCLVTWLAYRTGIPILFVDFRLAPEHPFPAALDDARCAYHWAVAHGTGGPSHCRRVFVGGDSSGAGLGMALCHALADTGMPPPVGLLALSPMLSFDEKTSRYVLDSNVGREIAHAYVGPSDPSHPWISPLNGDPSRLPRICVQVGTADKFLSDTEQLTERVQAQGGTLIVKRWEGMPHVWQRFVPRLPEALAAIEELAEVLEGWNHEL